MTDTNVSHTPGKWEISEGNRGLLISAPGRTVNGRQLVATVERVVGYLADPTPEAEANAVLMSAAPELLSALKATLRLWDEHGLGDDDAESEPVYLMVMDAIAKAEGHTVAK